MSRLLLSSLLALALTGAAARAQTTFRPAFPPPAFTPPGATPHVHMGYHYFAPYQPPPTFYNSSPPPASATYPYSWPVPATTRITSPPVGVLTPPARTVPDQPVRLTVNLPADAQLWIDGNRTVSVGAVRTFDSPPVTAGRRFFYELRARWTENGRPVEQTRRVEFVAGDRVAVTFPTP